MRLITEVVCNLKTIESLHLPQALDNKTEALADSLCALTQKFVWVLDKQGGCAYLIRVCVCLSPYVCVRQAGFPRGQVLAMSKASDQVPEHLMRYTKPTKATQCRVTCMCAAERHVSMVMMNEPSNHLFACLCISVRGCRMIHLTVPLPAAVSSKLITRQRESKSPSPSLARHEIFTSQLTAYLIA